MTHNIHTFLVGKVSLFSRITDLTFNYEREDGIKGKLC